MCFLPNRRASTDQAPGPIIAKVMPRVARIKEVHGSATREKKIQTSTRASSVPATGVQRPSKINMPKMTPISSGKMAGQDAALMWMKREWTRAAAVRTR